MQRLNIRQTKHLAYRLGSTPAELARLAKNAESLYRPKRIKDKKGKIREGYVPCKRLKAVLRNLNDLLQGIDLPDYIHGSRAGHSNISHAAAHVRPNTYLLTMDIASFFPSISHRRVYDVFSKRLGCQAEVARILTRISTYNRELPQGSPASPIIAVFVAEQFACRMQQLAQHHDAHFGIYVDDLAISGPAHIEKLIPLIEKIARDEGFSIADKTEFRHPLEEQCVTGVRVNQGIDCPSEKIRSLRQQIDHEDDQLSEASVRAKIRYVGTLNRGAGRSLEGRLSKAAQNSIKDS